MARLVALGALPLTCLWLVALAIDVHARFDAIFTELPSRVYSRTLLLRPGMDPEREGLRAHLERAGYRPVEGEPARAGEFAARRSAWRLWLRGFRDARGTEPERRVTLRLDARGRVASIDDPEAGGLAVLRLEPAPVGVFYGPRAAERDPVRLEELPPHLVDAVLAAEDRRFFEHRGLDLWRIAGALVANLRAQRVVQGGSTLTQQLVKNVYLTNERSVWRKLREAAIALLLERMHTKREILEAYLNEVYLAQSGSAEIHGVSEGARYYFGKPVQELDLGESALLASILPGPNFYAPHRRPEAARARRDFLLGQLLEQERISPEQYAQAVAKPLGLAAPPEPLRSHGYFMDWLRADLAARYGTRELETGGLEIFTSLDARLQRIAERALQRGLARHERDDPTLLREDSPLEGALVALAPDTGEVLAFVGGRDYGLSQFNRASEARRQPGSVFKPVVALAALSRRGLDDPQFTLASVLLDEPLIVPTLEGDWEPDNHDGEFRGEVTVREALERSLNVPVARMGQEVGLQRIIDTARGLGIESRLRPVPSLALGAFEVTLLEMTRAYAVLASGGRRAPAVATLAVADRGGALLEQTPFESQGVFDPAEVYLVTSALEGAVDRGTARGVRAWGYRGSLAGKTGTSNDYRDAWFIGYTPEIAVGVWVGFDDGASLHMTGASGALPIFADFLMQALGPQGRSDFAVPPGVSRVRVTARAGHPAGLRCGGTREVFLAGTAPTERCRRPFDRFADWLGGNAPQPEVWTGLFRELRRVIEGRDRP